jgi:hypothetical protein
MLNTGMRGTCQKISPVPRVRQRLSPNQTAISDVLQFNCFPAIRTMAKIKRTPAHRPPLTDCLR